MPSQLPPGLPAGVNIATINSGSLPLATTSGNGRSGGSWERSCSHAKNRTKAVAFPRQIAMYLCRQLTHASLSEIGRAFGGKDHTTVLHAVDKIRSLLQEDPKLHKQVDGLIQGITL